MNSRVSGLSRMVAFTIGLITMKSKPIKISGNGIEIVGEPI